MLSEQNGVHDLHHVELVTFLFEALAEILLHGFTLCFVTEIRILLPEKLLIDLITVVTLFIFQIGDVSLSLSRYHILLITLFFSF